MGRCAASNAPGSNWREHHSGCKRNLLQSVSDFEREVMATQRLTVQCVQGNGHIMTKHDFKDAVDGIRALSGKDDQVICEILQGIRGRS